MEKKVLKAVLYSPKQIKMMEAVMDELGSDSFTAGVHYCLMQTYRKVQPRYMRELNDSEVMEKKLLSKANLKENVRKMKEQSKANVKGNYCLDVMQGEVRDGMCYYPQWGATKQNDSVENCALSLLGDVVTDKDRFYPDRELVEKNRKDLKYLFKK